MLETGHPLGHGAQPEPTVHVDAGHRCRHPLGLSGVEKPRSEQVADVARERVDLPVVTVQGQGGEPAGVALDPEPVTEPGGQRSRPATPFVPAGPVEQVEQPCPADGRFVRIALHLAQGNGRQRARPVGKAHRVTGVLPALVGQATPALVDVLHKPAPGRLLTQPTQRRLQGRRERLDLLPAQPPAPRVVQQADPQHRRIDRYSRGDAGSTSGHPG